jgi:membrane-bound acyltransferase YfiQ involved in biofilm formation
MAIFSATLMRIGARNNRGAGTTSSVRAPSTPNMAKHDSQYRPSPQTFSLLSACQCYRICRIHLHVRNINAGVCVIFGCDSHKIIREPRYGNIPIIHMKSSGAELTLEGMNTDSQAIILISFLYTYTVNLMGQSYQMTCNATIINPTRPKKVVVC